MNTRFRFLFIYKVCSLDTIDADLWTIVLLCPPSSHGRNKKAIKLTSPTELVVIWSSTFFTFHYCPWATTIQYHRIYCSFRLLQSADTHKVHPIVPLMVIIGPAYCWLAGSKKRMNFVNAIQWPSEAKTNRSRYSLCGLIYEWNFKTTTTITTILTDDEIEWKGEVQWKVSCFYICVCMLVFTISGPFHSWCWFTLVIISFIKPKPSSFHHFLLSAPADDDDDEDGLKWLLLYFIAL